MMSARDTAVKREVFDHYGNVCACCGGTSWLSIDHVATSGSAHRMKLFGYASGGGGMMFYRWLRRNGYPEGYQTLCTACNTSKRDRPACALDHSSPYVQQWMAEQARSREERRALWGYEPVRNTRTARPLATPDQGW